MQIIGGKVSFKRSYQPEQYGSKGAEVEISFSMAEGEELGTKLDEVSALVKAKALALCGIKTEKQGAAPADVSQAAPKAEPEKTPDAKPKTRTKADLEAEKKAALDAKGPKSEAVAPAKEKAAEPESVGEDLGFDEDAAAAQVEITDAQLSTANNAAAARLRVKHKDGAPKLIKQLINTFVEHPKKTHDIPQNLRAEYLKKLAALE